MREEWEVCGFTLQDLIKVQSPRDRLEDKSEGKVLWEPVLPANATLN
jgi:hypothetical protein